jgi:acetate---CoA ligase (ADP-forming)
VDTLPAGRRYYVCLDETLVDPIAAVAGVAAEKQRLTGIEVDGPGVVEQAGGEVRRQPLGDINGKRPARHPTVDCQSGATAFGPFLVRAVENGIGFSYIISTGNEADLDFTDFARYLLDDPDTRVIAGFVEGFKEAD